MNLIKFVRYSVWITISSTMLITGVKFWDPSTNSATRGEYVAECYAGLVEKNVAYQKGTNAVVDLSMWPYATKYMQYYQGSTGLGGTNYWAEYMGTSGVDQVSIWISNKLTTNGVQNISLIPYWSLMYDRIMQYSRKYITTDDGKLFWIDPSFEIPADGAEIASVMTGWKSTLHEEGDIRYDVTMLTPSNMNAKIVSTDSRIYREGIVLLQGVTSNSLPIPKVFYPDITTVDTNTTFIWEKGNWWTQNNLGTNLYKFWNEMVYTSNGVVNIEQLDGSGYTLSTNKLYFNFENYNTPQNLTASKQTGVNGGAVYKLSSLTLDDNVIGVADSYSTLQTGPFGPNRHCYGSTTSFGSPETIFKIESGSTIVLYLDIALGMSKTVTITYSDGISGPASISWDELTPPYQGVITVTCPDGKAGVMSLVNVVDGVTTTYNKLVVVNPLEDAEILGFPYVGNGTTTFQISQTKPNASQVIFNDKRMLSTNLWETKFIHDGLKRTAYIVPYTELIYELDDNTAYHQTDGGNVFHGTAGDLDDDTLYTYFTTSIAGATPTTSTGSTWDGQLADIFVQNIANIRDHYISDVYDYSDSQNNWLWQFDWNQITDAKLNYPSSWAYANGYVARVRIYAIAKGSICYQMAYVPHTGAGETPITDEPDTSQPAFYDDKTHGVISYLCKHKNPEVALIRDSTRNDIIQEPFYYEKIHWTLLADVTSPSTQPLLTIGPNSISFSSKNQSQREFYYYQADNGPATDYVSEWTYYSQQTISISHFVVIVDWNFQHMNEEDPFTPDELNDPQWTLSPVDGYKTNYYRIINGQQVRTDQ